MNKGELNPFVIWWRALRYHFIPPSIFPATLGGVISWAINDEFSPWYFFLVLLGVVVNHMGVNMTDDYFDYKHSVDRLKPGEKNPYSGGSGLLSAGLIEPSKILLAFSLCYLATASIGFYLTLTRGLPILYFGLFGIFCSIFYTAEPIHFSHRGLGEIGLLINFGTTIGMGSYYVQSRALSLEPFLATLPLGIMLFSMIVINEIPDFEEDKLAGKLTLVARYGKRTGIRLYVLSWISTYSIILVGIVFRFLPIYTFLAFLSIPLVLTSVKILLRDYTDPVKMAPANLNMIKAHSVTSIGIILAYIMQGFINGSNIFNLLFIILVFSLTYFPAIKTFF